MINALPLDSSLERQPLRRAVKRSPDCFFAHPCAGTFLPITNVKEGAAMPDTEQNEAIQAVGGNGSHRSLTREELYALVWQTPMSRLAKTFGLSDVGLRKICVKHDIPTPPLGYWAKLAHGKRVHQPPLPPGDANVKIHLVARSGPAAPPAVTTAQEAALAQEADKPAITVPAERPAKLHPVAAATSKAVRSAKADSEGFKHGKAASGVETSIGAASIDRALCIIDAFARAADERGHPFREHGEGVRIVVDGVPFAWRLYEIKDRVPHQPTKEELRAQARREEDRARWPSLYSSRSDTNVYRSWDYLPSGRLAMAFTDTTCSPWDRSRLIGQWRDRKSKRLEEYLDEAIATLATAAVAVNHRLAEEAERERRRAEELERRRREQARRERALKRHEFILKKADEYGRYERLAAFASYLGRKAYRYGDEPVDRLISELRTIVKVMEEGFAREALQDEIVRLQLYTEEDPPVGPAYL